MSPDRFDPRTPEERQLYEEALVRQLYEEALVRQLYADLDRWDRGERP